MPIKQRYPLVPYLYMFISHVLSHMINDSTYAVHGLCLSNNSTIYNQCFTDDTTLYLKETLNNLERTFEVLKLFYVVLGSMLN